jgi:hypothetical protein
MKRTVWLTIRLLLTSIVLLYLIDWALLRVKAAHGAGFGTVQVEEYLSTPLKGGKSEYDFVGTQPEPCAHAIFPHGATPCWWLIRHTTRWE